MTEIEQPKKGFAELGYGSQEQMDIYLMGEEIEKITEDFKTLTDQEKAGYDFSELDNILAELNKLQDNPAVYEDEHVLSGLVHHLIKDVESLKNWFRNNLHDTSADEPTFNQFSTDNPQSDRMQILAERGSEEETE